MVPPGDDGVPPFALREFIRPVLTSRVEVDLTKPKCLTLAIASAPEGSCIVIPPGEYYECLTLERGVALVSDQGPVKIIGSGFQEAIMVTGGSCLLKGIAIEQTKNAGKGVISVRGGYLVVNKCEISGCGGGGAAVVVQESGAAELIESAFKGIDCPALGACENGQIIANACSFENKSGVGVGLKDTSKGFFTQCVFRETMSYGLSSVGNAGFSADSCVFEKAGLRISGSDVKSVVRGCRIQCHNGMGVMILSRAEAYIWCNVFDGCGMYICTEDTNVDLRRNNFANGMLHIAGSSKVVSTGDTVQGKVDVGVAIGDGTAVALRQTVIDNVVGCGIVSQGMSVEMSKVRVSRCSRSGIVARSNGRLVLTECAMTACETGLVISGGASGCDVIQCVFYTCLKSGAEIVNSRNVKLTGVNCQENAGCGIVISDSSVTLDTCGFKANKLSGLHIGGCQDTKLIKCQFDGNVKGGVSVTRGSSVSISDCNIVKSGWAGVFVDEKSAVEIERGVFTHNEFGAVLAGVNCSVKGTGFIENTSDAIRIIGNCTMEQVQLLKGKRGISLGANGVAHIVSCKFEENERHLDATDGGAANCEGCQFLSSTGSASIYVCGARLYLTKCWVVKNAGVGIIGEGEMRVTESIISESGKVGFYMSGASAVLLYGNRFANNGQCEVMVVSGTSTVAGNVFTAGNESLFAVFRGAASVMVAEQNQFTGFRHQSLWRE